MIRIAINGYGRIGRCILRAIHQQNAWDQFDLVAINDLTEFKLLEHLTKFDSTHGRFEAEVSLQGDNLLVDGHAIKLLAESDMNKLPWGELGIDVVFECSGRHTSRKDCEHHLSAGAKKVLISAPSDAADVTVVYGVNHDVLRAEHRLVSNASCTTNCLAPIAKVLHDSFGIEHGLMTTVHAYTNDQVLIDKAHGDMYRSRSATHSIIPTKTGAASAVGEVLPALKGRLDGMSLRVPVLDVSVVDFHATLARDASLQEINAAMRAAAEGPMRGVLAYNELALVSIDFSRHPASSVYDALQTRQQGRLLKTMAWYDNEWGFSNRMLDTARAMHAAGY